MRVFPVPFQPGGVAEWLCSGLQSRGRRFDSDPRLQSIEQLEQEFLRHRRPAPQHAPARIACA